MPSLAAYRLSPEDTQGAYYKVLSCLFFAVINGLVRHLTHGVEGSFAPLSEFQIAFVQNVFGFLFTLPLMKVDGLSSFRVRSPGLYAVRVLAAVAGVCMWYAALKHMPIGVAVALGFTGPIFTVIGARLWLNEWLTPLRLWGVALGLVGAFVIMRPDRMYFNQQWDFALSWSFLPLISAIAIAISKLASRRLGEVGEPPNLQTFYLLLFMIPVSAVPAMMVWTPMNLQHIMLLALVGACATGAHYTMAKAYALSGVLFLTPFGFARLFFSALIGYFAFGEASLTTSFFIGAGAILISGLVIAKDEHQQKMRLSLKVA
ncbi:MAG: DMT family transporter [Alphaproteobacteria bacterium]